MVAALGAAVPAAVVAVFRDFSTVGESPKPGQGTVNSK